MAKGGVSNPLAQSDNLILPILWAGLQKKNTTFATNSNWVPRPKCDPKTCPQVVNGCHLLSAQQGPSKERGIRRKEDACPRDLLHRIPRELCQEIYRVCTPHEWGVV